jgi:hypothetical protein
LCEWTEPSERASPIGVLLMARFLIRIGKVQLGKRRVLLRAITPGKNVVAVF